MLVYVFFFDIRVQKEIQKKEVIYVTYLYIFKVLRCQPVNLLVAVSEVQILYSFL